MFIAIDRDRIASYPVQCSPHEGWAGLNLEIFSNTFAPALGPLCRGFFLSSFPSSAHAAAAALTSAFIPISLSASVFAALSLCILRVSPLSVSGCNRFREGFSALYTRARLAAQQLAIRSVRLHI